MIANIVNDLEIWKLATTYWFWAGLGGWFVASFIKNVITTIRTGKLTLKEFVSTGGMPSGHSACISAIAFSICFTEGFDSAVAAVACCVAVIIMHDAATVRYDAGKHAKMLNVLVKPEKKLNEVLGHTLPEVIWGMITGIVWAFCLGKLWIA